METEVDADGRRRTVWNRKDPAPYHVELHRCRGCELLDVRETTMSKATNRQGLYLKLLPGDA